MKAGGNSARHADWPDDLLAPVSTLPEYSRLWIAFSGGLDSALLLHVAASCHPEITALHINHQLQTNHQQTEQFCRDVCERLGVPIVVEHVDVPVSDTAAGGLEEAARNARYQVFERCVGVGDLILMAHHGDDQAETVLFRMLRGSGVKGLSGMPESRSLGKGCLYRPWLALERNRLEQVAASSGVSWVEDPSNVSQVYDRNYLRHAIIPSLKKRWPGLLRRLGRSASACRESAELNQRLAELQWQSCSDNGRLILAKLRELSALEQRNLVRWWLQRQRFEVPASAGLDQGLADLLSAAEDRAPEIRGAGFSLRRYRGYLYLVPDVVVPEAPINLYPNKLAVWGGWELSLMPNSPAGTAKNPPPPIRVSTRQGGERVRMRPEGPSRALKTWLQEQGVPPWERAQLPLVYRQRSEGDELVAVGDLWCSDQYSGSAPATGWRLIVERDFD
ncbi:MULTISPECIES: tRNA lysidine(34) synthetase TilS [unclassified Marinobacter]|uniref:tRNA lysidine(34) synthetase TilS n=1 Tax=unclassified Marinobacter TaxID=83889 RepID=UPI00273BC767|nr:MULTISPECIES: tRNA lysidine(34) synthetase TilS [unclassified Marinobacter]MDP4548758.1 tRNA lysidine(34) synthetase TilS [Marinobacter sp. MDS2]